MQHGKPGNAPNTTTSSVHHKQRIGGAPHVDIKRVIESIEGQTIDGCVHILEQLGVADDKESE